MLLISSQKKIILYLILAFFISVFISFIYFYENQKSEKIEFNHLGYLPSNTRDYGDELVLIFIGSPTCPYSNDPELPDYIERYKNQLKNKARDKGYNYNTIAIGKTWNIEEGLRYLSDFGYFDEVIVGRNWNNIATRKYIYQENSISAMVPQLIVLSRHILSPEEGGFKVEDSNIVASLTGLNDIKDYDIKDHINF